MKLGYNEIMITSMYFNDIEDFINLEMGVKRFQGNMERFHFNPISLNEYSRKLFTNIETFHIYNRSDEIFNDGRIFKQVIWYLVSYSEYLQEKEQGNICKNIVYTQYDRKSYGNTIPSEVKSLGDYCFDECYELTTINIPTTISKLGKYCFDACKSLTSITIPTTISKLGYCCFYECTSLTTITIPSSVISIGHDCFEEHLRECIPLTSMNIENLQFISEERIFMNEPVLNIFKKNINEFIIPSSITKLGGHCFYRCRSLTSINIPTTISKIGKYCFEYCKSLRRIKIPSSISKLGDGCFYECSSLKSFYIPTTVSKKAANCFDGCSSLRSINIPTPIIMSLGNDEFTDCSSLVNINIENVKFICEDKVFIHEPVLVSFNTPDNLRKINGKKIKMKDINEFIIPSTITKLDDRCFFGCELLTSITIPTTISELGDYCFRCCASLKSITLPTTISEVTHCCFNECCSLSEVILPTTISELHYGCFYLCLSLTSINIPSSITSFGDGCLGKCKCTEELKKNKTIPRNAFSYIY
ncbi:hypothetical protein, conserved [Entamoeba dispar SAW760]|uniref:Leucine rich repeat containing protein BspA family protein n=1 Tax=Entamoeba dispar (strain ATCC PRA-260 / SAW760) TaxID=370354 RepID=B0EN64_ENTDS|nr:uncharacterized protein EDI_127560 [Entamoeba dispar SAW760]EDR24032.1 hypothetical protein, conserved [Entamoeba dispar SAW760]|eukprot:EDR24032.1 hypothetical protein, conserved [Entamoeba dispar SAW760]